MPRLASCAAGLAWPILVALLPAGVVSGRALQAQEGGQGATTVAPTTPAARVVPTTDARVVPTTDARVVPMTDAHVAARRIPRGTVLRAADMNIARVPARVDARGVVHVDTTPVIPGWIARRVIQRGEVLRAPAVAPAPLVAAGQAVQFTYQQDGLELTLDGVAPVAGSLGDTIPVRLGARRRVTGVVAGPARVIATDLSRTP
ncbi:MAG: flagellar basal body P-ring formation protein FlgA [Gemmatimonadetes bacterium]|nr:flagellar basal body P-ring formation protein FlgA [Gemmatimonadota bacterium]